MDAPAQVARGSTFSVKWTGPNAPEDYLTIVRYASDRIAGTFGKAAIKVT